MVLGQLVSFLHVSRLSNDFALPFSPRFWVSCAFLSVVSGEGEVILAELFLMLIVLHCVKWAILTKLYIFTMPRSRSVDCIPASMS